VLDWGANESGEGAAPAGLTNVTALAAGWSYSLALSGAGVILLPVTLFNPTWTSNTFSVSLQTQIGISYTLQSTSALMPANWTVVQSNSGTGGILTLTDPAAVGAQRFYRVQY
jgi:hypothetical protein